MMVMVRLRPGQLSLYLDFVPNKELLLKLAQQDLMFLNSFKFDNKVWAVSAV